MTDPRSMLDALAVPFPPHAIEKREGAYGKMLDYVATETVIRRLNRTVGVWDFRITEIKHIEQANLLVVWGEMTIPGLGTRSGTGVQKLQGGEDMWKGAASDCLKKCATQFGVGIDLYGPDLEAGEIPNNANMNNLPPRARNASQNTVPVQSIDFASTRGRRMNDQDPQQQRPQQNGNAPQARSGVPPTEPQFRMIGAIRNTLGMTEDELHQFAGVATLRDMDRAQVSDLITRLKALEAESRDNQPDDGYPSDEEEWRAKQSFGAGNNVPF